MREVVGRGGFAKLGSILGEMPRGDVLLITRERFVREHREVLCKHTGGRGQKLHTGFQPNPAAEEVQELVAEHGEWAPAVIIALGGGSAIDFAKAYRYYRTLRRPLIAIPTTAGTGSEATQFAVVYVGGKKTSLDDPSILPDVAVVDSDFLKNSPPYLKACTAMDALCQAIESVWALGGTEESRDYACRAIKLIAPAIRRYVHSEDPLAASDMAHGAFLAGKAINISRTTAAHALSYSITSRYGIPHGHAVALSMADLFAANAAISPENAQPGADVASIRSGMDKILALSGLESPLQFRNFWTKLMDDLGLEWRFRDLGITDKSGLVSSVNQQRLSNNPRDLRDVLPRFWAG